MRKDPCTGLFVVPCAGQFGILPLLGKSYNLKLQILNLSIVLFKRNLLWLIIESKIYICPLAIIEVQMYTIYNMVLRIIKSSITEAAAASINFIYAHNERHSMGNNNCIKIMMKVEIS